MGFKRMFRSHKQTYILLVYIAHDMAIFASRRTHTTYVIDALNLPGCVSQGDTFKEAINNITEAAIGLIESYIENKMPIPWEKPSPKDVRGLIDLKFGYLATVLVNV